VKENERHGECGERKMRNEQYLVRVVLVIREVRVVRGKNLFGKKDNLLIMVEITIKIRYK
jgi:hypothetical protein